MRLCATLLPGLLAGALPLVGRAQTEVPAAFKPQVFIGLGLSAGSYPVPNRFAVYVASPMPTLGVQLRPRLALQISAAYAEKNHEYFYPGQLYINGKLQRGISNGSSRQHTLAIPVLARYALTRRPKQHFQFDLLGGLAVVRSAYRSTNTVADSTQTVVSTDAYASANTGVALMLGPSLRYQCGKHVALTGDFIFNTLLTNPGTGNRLAATAALGLRYRFGRS